jgi:hypothetical protein
MKVSKPTFMILGAGIFIIALAGLGVARVGQVKEYNRVSADLAVNTARLNNLQANSPATPQLTELKYEIDEIISRTADIKERLKQSVISVDVSEKFFEVADYYQVTVDSIGTSVVSKQPFAGIPCQMISLSATVYGTYDTLVAFVKGLNDNFATGFVRSAQFNFDAPAGPFASVQMVVYTYREN